MNQIFYHFTKNCHSITWVHIILLFYALNNRILKFIFNPEGFMKYIEIILFNFESKVENFINFTNFIFIMILKDFILYSNHYNSFFIFWDYLSNFSTVLVTINLKNFLIHIIVYYLQIRMIFTSHFNSTINLSFICYYSKIFFCYFLYFLYY